MPMADCEFRLDFAQEALLSVLHFENLTRKSDGIIECSYLAGFLVESLF